jgi:hypothetical protein
MFTSNAEQKEAEEQHESSDLEQLLKDPQHEFISVTLPGGSDAVTFATRALTLDALMARLEYDMGMSRKEFAIDNPVAVEDIVMCEVEILRLLAIPERVSRLLEARHTLDQEFYTRVQAGTFTYGRYLKSDETPHVQYKNALFVLDPDGALVYPPLPAAAVKKPLKRPENAEFVTHLGHLIDCDVAPESVLQPDEEGNYFLHTATKSEEERGRKQQ